MVKKFIRRHMPSNEQIRANRALRILLPLFHNKRLWYFNRHSVCRAVAIGLFCAFIPIPFQMVLAAVIAIFFNANIPLSVGLVWITNPLTMPPIFYFTYKVGTFILDTNVTQFKFELTWHWLTHHLDAIWQPLILGSLLCGSVFATVGYITVAMLWRYNAIQLWRKRRQSIKKSAK